MSLVEQNGVRQLARGYLLELLPYPVVLDGYDAGQRVLVQRRAAEGEQEAAMLGMFREPAVRSVMVRDLRAGCFDFWVERRVGD